MVNDRRERVAQLVYERGMLYLRTELPAWVPGGNSLAQTEARAVAALILNAALAESGAVRVKPLVFEGEESDCFMTCDMGSRSYDLFVVDTLERSCDYVWKATHCESGLRDYALGGGTLEDAKAAAQAHHEARILAAIEPAPAVSVREAALKAQIYRLTAAGDNLTAWVDDRGTPDVRKWDKARDEAFRAIAEGKE